MTHLTELLAVDHAAPSAAAIERAAAVLRSSGLVAFPTETVYGLGAVARDRDAVRAVFEAKGRPPTDPLIVHAASAAALRPVVGAWPSDAATLAARFWPGPLTMVLPRTDAIADEVSGARSSVAIRVPAHPVAAALLAAVGDPIAAPSANRFGRISPTTADHVMQELDGRIDMVLDGGPTTLGIESTVVDLTGDVPEVLRPGGVTLEELQAAIGTVRHTERVTRDEALDAPAPGQFLRHYAPTTPLVLVDGSRQVVDELVRRLVDRGVGATEVLLPVAPELAARELYSVLRGADAGPAALLVVAMVDPGGLGRAVNDRMFRAAHGRVVLDASPSTVDRIAQLVG